MERGNNRREGTLSKNDTPKLFLLPTRKKQLAIRSLSVKQKADEIVDHYKARLLQRNSLRPMGLIIRKPLL